MAANPLRILLVDDDEDDFLLARDLLREISAGGFEIDWIQDYDTALATLRENRHDACLVDLRLGAADGIALIREAKHSGVELPIILLTGQGDHEIDLAAMNAGAADFLEKSKLTADTLERSLRYSIHSSRVEAQRAKLLAVAEQQAAQLRYLASELTQAEQRERRRIAQTLHDHLQQLLVAAKMRLDRLHANVKDPTQQKAARQIDELLSESIEASRNLTVQLSPPVLHDRGLVAAIEWLSRQFAKEHDLKVELLAIDDVEVLDEHVRDFLFQTVRELLFNVVKHAGVSEAQVVVRRAGPELLQVTVRDEGKGCDPRRLLEGSSEEGFGLFHAQRRVEFLGGTFEVESGDGGGCAVSITVPARGVDRPSRRAAAGPPPFAPASVPAPAPPAAPSSPPAPPVSPPPGVIRVLLADDHKILREGLAGLLRDQPGIEVVGEAADGLMAVELSQRLLPDVVVMDVTMPGMSGIEATQVIKRARPEVRVIGLSMHEAANMALAMREAGADAYLPKGGPADDLISAIWRSARDAARQPGPVG